MFENVNYVSAAGWCGVLFIFVAYLLNVLKVLLSDSNLFLWMNLLGATMLVVNTYYTGNRPIMLLNIVWVLVAVYGLLRRSGER